MITGSCLCGAVRYEIDKAAGPFELCHCRRCRKLSGSAFTSGLGVMLEDFRFIHGEELITVYEAPILRAPPAYRSAFCSRCGSQVPCPLPGQKWFEIPAGSLDDDPELRPDKHIFVEFNAPWFTITDDLPQYDMPRLQELRERQPKRR
jgi:hypothetical protein